MSTFTELGLSKQIAARIEKLGFTEPTEIQTATIAKIMAGHDVMGSAETGSGKTAAYALPIIDRLGKPPKGSHALILVPTRELALQVRAEFERFSMRGLLTSTAIYGGCAYNRQIADMRKQPSIMVATPGRLFDLLDHGQADLSAVKYLVIDEADRMMDLGFMPQIRKIIARIPKQRQTLMFSATLDARMEGLAQEYLHNPVRIQVQQETVEPQSIDQKFHPIAEAEKNNLLIELVAEAGEGSVLVFTRTRRKAKQVARRLRDASIEAKELHGDITQNQREKTIDQYRKGQFTVLVATDIAARGLDIPSITKVVNYDLPQSASDYIHRIGRTGRAGRSGCSHTFVVQEDAGMVRQIERLIGRNFGHRPANANGPAASPAPAGRPARRRFGSGFRQRTQQRAR